MRAGARGELVYSMAGEGSWDRDILCLQHLHFTEWAPSVSSRPGQSVSFFPLLSPEDPL